MDVHLGRLHPGKERPSAGQGWWRSQGRQAVRADNVVHVGVVAVSVVAGTSIHNRRLRGRLPAAALAATRDVGRPGVVHRWVEPQGIPVVLGHPRAVTIIPIGRRPGLSVVVTTVQGFGRRRAGGAVLANMVRSRLGAKPSLASTFAENPVPRVTQHFGGQSTTVFNDEYVAVQRGLRGLVWCLGRWRSE